MSLYPQSQTYGQVSYPVQGYGQPMVPPTYHYPVPVQPVFHLDPNMFRRDYMSRLGELTVNSRPIIQNLSMIAQEYSRYAEIVVQSIEAHIRRVSLNSFSISSQAVVLACFGDWLAFGRHVGHSIACHVISSSLSA